MRIPLNEATKAELQAHCAIEGLEFDGRAADSKLRALIAQSGWTKDYIEIGDVEVVPQPSPKMAADGDYVTVVIQQQENEADEVYLGCNGSGLLAKRGVPSRLSRRFFDSLNNAKRQYYPPSDEGIGDPIEVHAYPFTVVG